MKLFKRRAPADALPETGEPPKNIRVNRPRNERAIGPGDQPSNEALGESTSGVSQAGSGPMWRSAARIVAWGVFISALVGASIMLGRGFEDFVRSSKRFAIKTIEIEGNTQLSDEEIVTLAGLRLGENIFQFKGEEIETRLRSHPALRSVRVERGLPSRFTIRIEEYRPVALVALDKLYLLAREGIAYRPLEPGESVDLPIVSFADPDAPLEERRTRQQLLFEAASIIDAIDRHNSALLSELMELHIREDHRFILRFFDERMDVFLGRGDYPAKLGRLRVLLRELDERELRASRVHIDNELRPERVTVRLRLSE